MTKDFWLTLQSASFFGNVTTIGDTMHNTLVLHHHKTNYSLLESSQSMDIDGNKSSFN